MNSKSTLATVAEELAEALSSIAEDLSSAPDFESLLLSLGWSLEEVPAALQPVAQEAAELAQSLESFRAQPVSPATALELVNAVARFVDIVEDLRTADFGPVLNGAGIRELLPSQLLDTAILSHLERNHRSLAFALQSFGIVRRRFVPEFGIRPGHTHQEIAWPDVASVLDDPGAVFRIAFGWGEVLLDGQLILEVIQDLLLSLRVPAFLTALPSAEASALDGAEEPPGEPDVPMLETKVFEQEVEGVPVTVGFRLFPLRPSGSDLPGIGVLPFASSSFDRQVELGAETRLRVEGSLSPQGGLGLLLRPDRKPEAIFGFDDPVNATHVEGTLRAAIERMVPGGAADEETTPLLGTASGTRLEAAALSATAAALVESTQDAELFLETELQGGRLVLASGEGDAFFRRILPSDGIAVRFDAAVGLSSERGFYFRGSSALDATFPTHFSVGAIDVSSVTVALRPSGDRVVVEAGAAVSAGLGPLVATVKNVGLRADLGFPGSGGNLGPIDVDLDFKPPDGVGLALEGAGFAGGGFLRVGPDEGRYSGLLELEFEGRFTIKALGLLTTRLPGGEEGFSLLVSLNAELDPVQLGLGFTLNGVGGLLGLNRSVEIERLRRGVKEKTLDDVLFPTDLVANADRILSDLQEVFPQRQGRFTFGPMALIGWGTPTLISIELGLVVEVPSPVRAALLGVLKSLLPDDERRLVVLQVNFLGVLELEKRQISFDATLFESRLLTYTLDGDMAARVVWGESPNLLVTVGGFHPDYEPPPLALPSLQRITVNLLGGKSPRLTLESYYAITSNTAQFGARLELYAKASKFNVYGHLGFDALFQFNPFHFAAALDAGLAVRIGSRRIMGVQFSGSLEGPAPWKVSGKATFKIVFVKFKVRFNKTFGEERDTRLPDVDVQPLLVAALGERGNWSTELPARLSQLVSLRAVGGPPSVVRLHPVGTLVVSQRVAPLGITLTRFGNRRPSGSSRFTITRVSSGGETLSREPAREQFAPAQFQDFDDQERLSRKSFERLESGVRIAAAQGLHANRAVTREVIYERKIIDRAGRRRRGHFREPLRSFEALVAAAAAPSSDLGQTPAPASPLAPDPVSVAGEGFAVVQASDLTLAAEQAEAPTQAEAVELMRNLVAARPERAPVLQIVPSYEVNPT